MNISDYKKGSIVRAWFTTGTNAENYVLPDGKVILNGVVEDDQGYIRFEADCIEEGCFYRCGTRVYISGVVEEDDEHELFIRAMTVKFDGQPIKASDHNRRLKCLKESIDSFNEDKEVETKGADELQDAVPELAGQEVDQTEEDSEYDYDYEGELPFGDAEELMESFEREEHIRFLKAISEQDDLIKKGCESIKGQERVVSQVIHSIQSTKLTGSKSESPQTFLFAGPPGTGKSELAKLISKSLGMKRNPLVLDMNDYVDAEDSTSMLVGISATWKSAASGVLTSYALECNEKDEPFVVICDEIEKAHPKIINIFIGILENGETQDKYLESLFKMKKSEALEKASGGVYERRLKDHWNDEEKDVCCHFNNAIFFFTTNAGKSIYENPKINTALCTTEQIIKAIGQEKDPATEKPVFSNAILSRFESNSVYMFNNLLAYDLIDVAKDNIMNHELVLEKNTGYDVVVENPVDIAVSLLLQMGGKGSARKIRKRAQNVIRDGVNKVINSFAADVRDNAKRVVIKIADEDREQFNKALFGERETVDGFDVDTVELLLVNPGGNNDIAVDVNEYKNVDITDAKDFESAEKILSKYKYSNPMVVLNVPGPKSAKNDKDFVYEFDLTVKFFEYKRFIEKISNLMPNAFVCVTSDVRLSTQTVDAFYKVGVTKIIDTNQTESLRDTIEEIRLASVAFNFERKNQHLEFEMIPKVIGEDIEVRLGAFETKPNMELSSDGGFITEDRMPNVTLDDYIGAEAIKEEVEEFIKFLKNPKIYARKGIEAPKALMLYGPPGTGKTQLAKAIAHDSGVPFFSYNGGDLKIGKDSEGKTVGTIALVKEAFSRARNYAPSILFIDEFDAIARIRGIDKESDAIVNALLSEMDGFEDNSSKPIVIIAATNKDIEYNGSNYHDYIDDAVVSRFTRKFYKGAPSTKDRTNYLTEQTGLDETELITSISLSIGMSYRELRDAVELAKRKHFRIDGTTKFNGDELQDAIETINYGEKTRSSIDDSQEDRKKRIMRERESVAYHEAGHATAHCLLGNVPDYATIVARGGFGGYVQSHVDEDKGTLNRQEIGNRIIACLAGRAAEVIKYGDEGISTGASQDIKSAYNNIMNIVCKYGMDEKIGITYYNLPRDPSTGALSENLPPEIQERVNELFAFYYKETLQFLNDNKEIWETIAKELMNKTFLTREDMSGIVKAHKK